MSKKSDPRNKTFFKREQAYSAWLSGHSFVPHTAELLNSPAWRARSLYARRLIDRLELEHAGHNGGENGFIKLTYRQMQKAGIHSNKIGDTLQEVEELGLVTITHRGAYRGGARNNPSTYRLNYLPWKFAPATGAPVYYVPLDEWTKYTGKSARPKSARMHRTGGATSIYTGGANNGEGTREISANSAKTANTPNAPHGWKRSSILRSTREAATQAAAPALPIPPPGAERLLKPSPGPVGKIGAATGSAIDRALSGGDAPGLRAGGRR